MNGAPGMDGGQASQYDSFFRVCLRRRTLTAKTKFQLTKWYADCIGENGDAIIVYCGIARWRAITLRYASRLEANAGKRPQARYSLRKCVMPAEEGTTVRWRCKSLEIEGTWERLDPAFDAQIYESPEGSIEWHCLHPRARVRLNLGNGVVVRGLGYVERMEMSVAPWSLPLEELRWGRFLSETDSLVWIDWRGEKRRTLQLGLGTPRPTDAELSHRMPRFRQHRWIVCAATSLFSFLGWHCMSAFLFSVYRATQGKPICHSSIAFRSWNGPRRSMQARTFWYS